MKLIENNIQKIIALCKRHKVNKLFVFGSILTNRFNDNSDVDLVVSFNKAEVSDYFDWQGSGLVGRTDYKEPVSEKECGCNQNTYLWLIYYEIWRFCK